mgnify:CR=1 FL=1
MRAPIRLGLQIPNFNFPGVGPDTVFDKLVDIATTAERAGFTAVDTDGAMSNPSPTAPATSDRRSFELVTMTPP